ncbi:MAG: SdpI family protein [Peptostreptococcaceae bacterium]|nr:SdpI family protein [Peptostreptococcaceae bacterium]
MRKISTKRLIVWVLAIVPLLIIGIFNGSLPEQIPIHWSLDGSVQYGSHFTLWINGSMGIIFAILFPILRKIDPRSKNYDKFGKYYDEFQIFMMLFFIALTSVIVSESLNPGRINVEMVIVLLVGILFTIIGNMMPKFKNNFFIGIRTPWTLANEEVWNRTHRLGGIMWFFGGLAIIAAAIILNSGALFTVVMVVTLTISIVPTFMSYFWFREIKK